MKKTPLLNIALSQLIASLGHGDSIVIGDAGLPVPMGIATIDLALTRGIPSFMDTLLATLAEMHVEYHILANELNESSPQLIQQIDQLGLAGRQTVPHEELRHRTRQARAVIRTGEFTPYANIILVAGAVFNTGHSRSGEGLICSTYKRMGNLVRACKKPTSFYS